MAKKFRDGFTFLFLFGLVSVGIAVAQKCDEVLAKNADSVVSLEVEIQKEETGEIATALGTGFVFTRRGHVITADHVLKVDGGWTIRTIKGSLGFNGEKFDLEILEKMPEVDMAFLKFKLDKDYRYARIGNPRKVEPSNTICSLGFSRELNLHLLRGSYVSRDSKTNEWISLMDSSKGESGAPLFSDKTGYVVALKRGIQPLTTGSGTISSKTILVPLYRAQDAITGYCDCKMVDDPDEPIRQILPVFVTELTISMETMENPKDSALDVFLTAELNQQKIGSGRDRLGSGKQWKKGQVENERISLSSQIPIDKCKEIRIILDKTRQFQWDVRFTVDGKLSDGRTVQLLPKTKIYKLGDNDDYSPAIEYLQC